MSAELLPVWSAIEEYIDSGISVIPVRDKDDNFGVAKSPFGKSWKLYQQQIISKQELFDLMDIKYNTIAVGIVGGKVSGNLEIIDIDVKYKPGIDAILFTDLKTLYPDLIKRLRIHKSPSGGFHILYRCEAPVEGNQKLAGRHASPEELARAPKSKTYNFLETRGEGGYVVAPPALGYRVIKDIPIPTITATERDSIITLCRSYNEIIKVENSYTPNKQEIEYYDTSPFADFDAQCNPSEIMNELGWKEFKHNNHFVWYTRPDKNTGVSMSFNLQKRFFYCFTASTELEENKGYSPSNLLSIIKHNGDKKKLHADLVSRGYGRIKPKIEAKLVKTAAINGKPLPKNISTEAVSIHSALSAALEQQHPYGVFWIDSLQHGIQIDRFKLYAVAFELGFKNLNEDIVQITPCSLSTVGMLEYNITKRHFADTLKDYIKEDDADLHKDIFNALDAFLEKHAKHITANLPILDTNTILADTVDAAYKVYTNGILKITSQGNELLPVTKKLIKKDRINNRDFNYNEGGCYVDFLKLATDYDTNTDYILSCIGFLAHEFKDETAGYIIVLTEQVENPKDGGGAGKNVFSELFKNITSFVNKPGSQVKYDETFMQSWNGQKIFCLSDVPKNFHFGFLKELSTGSGLMKKLYKDETSISSDMMPKFLIQTNYSYEVTDGGLRRRIKGIEFTDFFTKSGGVDVHFGAHFPNEWNADDWAGFDTIMATAIQKWLQNNRKIGSSILSASGWAKQFEQTYGVVITEFIKENIDYFTRQGKVSNEDFNKVLQDYFTANNIRKQPYIGNVAAALRDWCSNYKILFVNPTAWRENGIHVNGKMFLNKDDVPF